MTRRHLAAGAATLAALAALAACADTPTRAAAASRDAHPRHTETPLDSTAIRSGYFGSGHRSDPPADTTPPPP